MEKAPRPSIATITKKIIMALTGLFLCGFLVAHLAGNLLLLNTSNSFNWFNTYARTLNAVPFLELLELGLAAIFLIHAYEGFSVWRQNKNARPEEYAGGRKWTRQGKSEKSRKTVSSTTMMVTGIVILLFVGLHVWHMKYHYSIGPSNPISQNKAGEAAPDIEVGTTGTATDGANGAQAQQDATDLAAHVVYEFKKPYVIVIYLLAMIALGFHLYHALWSSFQTLGVTNTKVRRGAILLNNIFAIVVAGTFALLPVWVFFIYQEPTAQPTPVSAIQQNQEQPR